MSASAKKKLRKEQNSAQLTEKQLTEQKEIKKLKAYTTIFVAAIAIVLVAGIIIAGFNFYKNSGIKEKNTIAATVGDHQINSVELSYYYADTLDYTYRNWTNSYGDSMSMVLAMMGLDLTQPLNTQQYNEEQTWADYFVEAALETAQRDYLLADKAIAEGFTLSEESLEMLEETFTNLPSFASIYGYTNVENYLHALYGPGASEDSYREYAERSALASDYYQAYSDNLVFDDAALRAHEANNFDAYSSFAYANYNLSYSYFLTGGTEDEEGNITYSEEEKEAARAAAKAAAESLPQCSTVEELNAAIAALNLGEDAQAECNVYNRVLYSNVNSNIRDWVADSSRKDGDFTIAENESTTTDENGVETTTVNAYSVYVFLGRDDNHMPLANVRHILVNFQCENTEEHDHETYTDEEKAAALEKAENLLMLFESGVQSEETFAELAIANSDDTGSIATGGLYEDITPEQGVYVESFTNWATDPAREAGNTGIIESEYGYHVMYYVGDDEMTYRDSMIHAELKDENLTAWYNEVLSAADVIEVDTSLLNKAVILSQ